MVTTAFTFTVEIQFKIPFIILVLPLDVTSLLLLTIEKIVNS